MQEQQQHHHQQEGEERSSTPNRHDHQTEKKDSSPIQHPLEESDTHKQPADESVLTEILLGDDVSLSKSAQNVCEEGKESWIKRHITKDKKIVKWGLYSFSSILLPFHFSDTLHA
jgi:hypothetical protein